MGKGEALTLEEHAGFEIVEVGEFLAAVVAGVAVVADDGEAAVEEVAADLVVAAGLWDGFDEGKIFSEAGEDAEVRLGVSERGVGSFLDGFLAGPLVL